MFQKHKEMGGLYITSTDMRNVYKILVGILGRPVFRNPSLVVRIILKWDVKRCIYSLDWKQAVVITVPLGCTQGEECLDQLSESDSSLLNQLFTYR